MSFDPHLHLMFSSELLSNVAVEGEGEEESSDDDDQEDAPSVSMATTCTAYSLIETAHPVFGMVKGLWNSPTESHREVSLLGRCRIMSISCLSHVQRPLDLRCLGSCIRGMFVWPVADL